MGSDYYWDKTYLWLEVDFWPPIHQFFKSWIKFYQKFVKYKDVST